MPTAAVFKTSECADFSREWILVNLVLGGEIVDYSSNNLHEHIAA